MNRFQFVADHQTTYQVKRLCQVLELSRSSMPGRKPARPVSSALRTTLSWLHGSDGSRTRKLVGTRPTGHRG